ncbi:hypothetical protein RB2654_15235 [Rhodobacterales bacterium HTCC2654]|uniref:Uncharacterized protein n=1 Tax=Maritimibacter alkaliphilus HTCC2654 TaxID=314271 RepID=A3VH96_9RHOB|nr:hypothetical protein RB2654_15235 [Rhodobacterales bacterium HTCC2654] [Maritimibacter alkaliphilus HTCC2654]
MMSSGSTYSMPVSNPACSKAKPCTSSKACSSSASRLVSSSILKLAEATKPSKVTPVVRTLAVSAPL